MLLSKPSSSSGDESDEIAQRLREFASVYLALTMAEAADSIEALEAAMRTAIPAGRGRHSPPRFGDSMCDLVQRLRLTADTLWLPVCHEAAARIGARGIVEDEEQWMHGLRRLKPQWRRFSRYDNQAGHVLRS